MSGGIDSAAALILLKKQGWDPVGVTLQLPVWRPRSKNHAIEPERAARRICRHLHVPHFSVNAAGEFKKEVVEYFVSEYKNYRVPNPCVMCNPHLKLKILRQWAAQRNIPHIATGHYARIRKNSPAGKYELWRAKYKSKDQSYDLCLLDQKTLADLILPLGNYSKKEVRRIVRQAGLNFLAEKKESENFCFLSDQPVSDFLLAALGEQKGEIRNQKGKVLSAHAGLHFYTPGQRKGIRLSGGPYFVLDRQKKQNVLVVTKNKKDLYQKEFFVYPYHLISGERIRRPFSAQIKIRYRHPLLAARIIPEKNKLRIAPVRPAWAPCPGQFAVFYHQEQCLGGGRII